MTTPTPTVGPTRIVAFSPGIAASLHQLEDGSSTHSPIGGHFGANANIDEVEPAPLGLKLEGWVHSLQRDVVNDQFI